MDIRVKLSGYGGYLGGGNPDNLTPNSEYKTYTYKNAKSKMLSVARALEHFNESHKWFVTMVTFTKVSSTVELQTFYANYMTKKLVSALRKRGIRYYYMIVTETTPNNHIHSHLVLLHDKKWISYRKSGFVRWAKKNSIKGVNNVHIQHEKKRGRSKFLFYSLKYIRKMHYIADETAKELQQKFDKFGELPKHQYNLLKAYHTRKLSSLTRLWNYTIPYKSNKVFKADSIIDDIETEIVEISLNDSAKTKVEIIRIVNHFSKLSKYE